MENLPLCLEQIILGYKKDMEQYDIDLKEWIYNESFRYTTVFEHFLDIGIYDYGMNDGEVFKTFKDFDYNYNEMINTILFETPIIVMYNHFGNMHSVHCDDNNITVEDFVCITEYAGVGDHIFLEEIEVLCEFEQIGDVLYRVIMLDFGS